MPVLADVRLLLHCDGADGAASSYAFKDSSLDGRTLTVGGNAQLDTAQYKFGVSSAYFDGTGDYLEVAHHADFNFETGDFTAEAWVRPADAASSTVGNILGKGLIWSVYWYQSRFHFTVRNATPGTQFAVSSASTFAHDAWHHVAAVRDGSTFRLFVDGVQEASASYAGDLQVDATKPFRVGYEATAPHQFLGWIDEVRVTAGAWYTAGFTVPSAAFEGAPPATPTFSDVVLLVKANGADASTTFTDESPLSHTVTAGGNAQVDTAQSMFGGASAYFDGAGDWLNVPHHASLEFAATDFTLEAWVRPADAAAGAPGMVVSKGFNWTIFWYDSKFHAFTSAFNIPSSGTYSHSTWHHVALARDGFTFRLFVNGVVAATFAFSDTLSTSSDPVRIGYEESGPYPFYGWIDEVRLTSRCWYTGDFTVPDQPFHELAPRECIIAVPGPLGAVEMLGQVGPAAAISVPGPLGAPRLTGGQWGGSISVPGPLGAPSVLSVHDFTGQLSTTAPVRYVMDLVTPGGLVRVPISTWQATLQIGSASYAQCTVPAATDWADTIAEATEFVVSRVGRLDDGSALEYEMVRAPLQSVPDSQGPRNRTASLSGYFGALPDAEEDPPAVYDRQLQGVRSVSLQSTGTTRVRCAIDWLLRPGHRAYNGPDPIIVQYINWYVTSSGDQYMDLGDRAV